MHQVTQALLTAAVSLTPLTGAGAQVTKPRVTPGPMDRLPAPAELMASQQADGSIRVVWKAVTGAVSYSMTRSVPPASAQQVELPKSPDTVYLDRDVRPGSSYYYLVSAVNESGIGGLKKSTAPVLAVDRKVPDPPQNVKAVQQGDLATLTWSPPPDAARFRIDVSTSPTAGAASWSANPAAPQCCSFQYGLTHTPPGSYLRFRVIAESRSGYVSKPGLSNEIVVAAVARTDTSGGPAPRDTAPGPKPPSDTTSTAATNVRPAVVAPTFHIRVGASVNARRRSFFTDIGFAKVRWLSLDEAIATVNASGRIVGQNIGLARIVAIGVASDGAVASLVQPVQVRRK